MTSVLIPLLRRLSLGQIIVKMCIHVTEPRGAFHSGLPLHVGGVEAEQDAEGRRSSPRSLRPLPCMLPSLDWSRRPLFLWEELVPLLPLPDSSPSSSWSFPLSTPFLLLRLLSPRFLRSASLSRRLSSPLGVLPFFRCSGITKPSSALRRRAVAASVGHSLSNSLSHLTAIFFRPVLVFRQTC